MTRSEIKESLKHRIRYNLTRVYFKTCKDESFDLVFTITCNVCKHFTIMNHHFIDLKHSDKCHVKQHSLSLFPQKPTSSFFGLSKILKNFYELISIDVEIRCKSCGVPERIRNFQEIPSVIRAMSHEPGCSRKKHKRNASNHEIPHTITSINLGRDWFIASLQNKLNQKQLSDLSNIFDSIIEELWIPRNLEIYEPDTVCAVIFSIISKNSGLTSRLITKRSEIFGLFDVEEFTVYYETILTFFTNSRIQIPRFMDIEPQQQNRPICPKCSKKMSYLLSDKEDYYYCKWCEKDS